MDILETPNPGALAGASGAWTETAWQGVLKSEHSDRAQSWQASLVWSAASGSVERLALVRREAAR